MAHEYRALQIITVDGVRAYNPGDWVPDANVEAHGYVVGEQVEQVEIKPPADEGTEAEQPPVVAVVPESAPPAATADADKPASDKPAVVKPKRTTPPA